jgi:hypothetical protein
MLRPEDRPNWPIRDSRKPDFWWPISNLGHLDKNPSAKLHRITI